MRINRDIYFQHVRASLFGGHLDQRQVDGQNAILDGWEETFVHGDLRKLGFMLATTYHETSQEMWPIEEYGGGAGQPYGVPDPQTGQTYYGRGYVQITWRENYQRATDEIGLEGPDDLVWHADRALDPDIAFMTMARGMSEGWFRSDDQGKQTLGRYFNDTTDDPYGAREIINGDKSTVPSWSNGVSIGNLIKGYYMKFTAALNAATMAPQPEDLVTVSITTPEGVDLQIIVNGIIIAV